MPVTVFMDTRVLRAFDKDMQDLAMDLAGSNRMRQPLLKIGKEVLAPSIKRNFAVGGRPNKWAQVGTSSYRDKKGDKSGGSPPLWVTGKLKRAASSFARFKVKENELTYGYFPSSTWFAIVHDNAKIAKKADIPQRPFALIQHPKDSNDAMEILWDWYEDQINANIKRIYV